MSERTIDWGEEVYALAPNGGLENIRVRDRTPEDWLVTDGAELLARISGAVAELYATGFITEHQRLQQLARAQRWVEREATHVFDPVARLSAYSIRLSCDHLGITESPHDPEFYAAAAALFDKRQEMWITETVESCYPEEAAALKEEYPKGMQDDTECQAKYQELYDCSIHDFSFAQARGRALFHLGEIQQAFEVAAPLFPAIVSSIRSELGTLRQEAALLHGLRHEEFDHIYELAAKQEPVRGAR